MFFLIRVAFWLSIVVLLLPTGKTDPAQTPQFGASDALSAASAAVSDMRGFCGRQPEACNIGSQAATAFGQKAQASAKMLYDYFTERSSSDERAPAAARPAEATPAPTGKPSQNTLSASDRAPAFRGTFSPNREQYARRQ